MGNVILIFIMLINSIISVADASSEELLDYLPSDYSKLEFKEVGKAKFSVLFWDIYNSSLYTKSGNYIHQYPPELILFKIEYLKDITSDDLLKRTVQQWQHLEVPESQYAQYLPKLKSIWPNISVGDSLTLFVKKGVSIFYFNNMQVGVIHEHEFSKLFLDIWLSPKTSQEKLREKLLGGNTL